MTENMKPEALLKHLGMTEYEAKAYLSLISSGSLKADEIAKFADIPLPRVYDTVLNLSKRGLVMVSKTRPQVYKVADPRHLMRILKEDEKKKIEERIKEIEEVFPKFLKSIPKHGKNSEKEAEDFIIYAKRKANTESLWADFHKESKKEILIFAGDLSWTAKYSFLLENLIKKGVSYKILWSTKAQGSDKNARKLMKLGAEIRFSTEFGNFRGIIIDDKKVSILNVVPKSEGRKFRNIDLDAEKHADYTTIVIGNRPIVGAIRSYFSILWERATPAGKIINN